VFEGEIRAFEAEDRASPPLPGGIVFVGSSTIRGWHEDLARDLEPLRMIGRGFGGSTLDDALYYIDRVVIRYVPRAVVLYEGDNDLAQGVEPEEVMGVFEAFRARLYSALPRVRLYVLSVKPSTARLALWPRMLALNSLLSTACSADPRMRYVDIAGAMLTSEGTVRPGILQDDDLHMTRAGYRIWRDVLRPILLKCEGGFDGYPDPT
jgi:lysophospholipase L1-like esterase